MRKVLVVEDEEDIVTILQTALQRNNYEVITANNGEEALDKIDFSKPDLILLDLMLPKVDGFTVNLRLKDNPETASIPVIVITGKGNAREFFNIKEGATIAAYYEKPVPVSMILKRIKELLG
ncbi:MAG: response regulator [Elusimicrobiota bacterium]